LNREVHVWEGDSPARPLLAKALAPDSKLRVIAGGILCDEAINRSLVALIPDLVKEVPSNLFEFLVGEQLISAFSY
jgi:hypothetical protein